MHELTKQQEKIRARNKRKGKSYGASSSSGGGGSSVKRNTDSSNKIRSSSSSRTAVGAAGGSCQSRERDDMLEIETTTTPTTPSPSETSAGVPKSTGGDDWAKSLSAFHSRLRWRSHFIQKLESEPEIELFVQCRYRADTRSYLHRVVNRAIDNGNANGMKV